MELEIGDIIGYKPKATASWLSALIKLGGKQRYSHVMMYIGDGKVIEAGIKGVKISPLWVNPEDYENVTVIRKKGGLSAQEKEMLLNVAHSFIGKPYDAWHYPFLFLYAWFGRKKWVRWILRVIMRIDDDEFTNCSETLARIWYEALAYRLGNEKSFDFVLPDDIMDNPDFERVN